jgi:SET domain-containing protein
MYFHTPSSCLKSDYMSDKIINSNKNDYCSIRANEFIKKGEILLKEYPKINLFGEEETDKGLQVIKIYILHKENELYPRNYNYNKTCMVKNIHKIIKNADSKLKKFFESYSKEEIEFYYAKYLYNTFEGFKYGPLTLPLTAKLNHSCNNPNVEFNFDEKTGQMITKAIRNIKKGEELFISYLMNKQITNHKEYLYEHYGFHCDC